MEPKTETEPVDDEAISKAEDITAETEAAPAVAPAPGQRRRGRRKVMKRRTIKDEEGYLGKLSIYFCSFRSYPFDRGAFHISNYQ